MNIFTGPYIFEGEHAFKVSRLVDKGLDNKLSLFDRVLDLYLIAPLIGFMYSKKSKINNIGYEEEKKTIFRETLEPRRNIIEYNYRLIMLLDEKNEKDVEKRIDKAFRFIDTEDAEKDEDLFNSYVRGGIDYIYERITTNSYDFQERVENLFYLIDDYYNDFLEETTSEDIEKLITEMSKNDME